MQKIIRLESLTTHNEPTIQLIRFNEASQGFCKTADEHTEEFLKTIKPKPGKTFALLLAMTAHEFYGPNSNKDSFTEKTIPGIVEEGETLKDCYRSFESSAKVFKHHKNRDPNKGIGDIVRAFYNDAMHRVELLVELDNQKAADIIEKIERGEYPPVSMGCRVKYDVCSVPGCHNKARNLGEYCEHTRHRMGEIDPDTGAQIFVYNPAPMLFDISFVLRPADKVAYMMKKVADVAEPVISSAQLGEMVKLNQLKASAIKKLSDIDKVITGQTAAANADPSLISFTEHILPTLVSGSQSSMSKGLCDDLSNLPLDKMFSTLHKAKVVPTGKEVCYIVIRKSCPETKIDPKIFDLVSAIQGPLRSLMGEFPEIIDALQDNGIIEADGSHADKKVLEDHEEELVKRSYDLDAIYGRVGQTSRREADLDQLFGSPSFEQEYARYVASQQILQAALARHRAQQILGALGLSALGLAGYGSLASVNAGRLDGPTILGQQHNPVSIYDLLDVATLPGTDIPVDPYSVLPYSTKRAADNRTNSLSLAMIAAQDYFPTVSTKTASFKEAKAYHLSLLEKSAQKSKFIASLVNLHNGFSKEASTFEPYFENIGEPTYQGPVRLNNLIVDLGREIVRATT